MTKGTKLSEFEEGEITALKRVRNCQREIWKALRRSKPVICNYLKSPNKYGISKPTGRPEKLSQFMRRIVRKVKKKTLSKLKILKFLGDSPCTTRTIRRDLNKEKIKHKKRIHRPRLTMKYKEKRLEHARQYQTTSAKECWKVVFSDERKLNFQMAFRSTSKTKNYQKKITQQGGSFHL